MKSFFNDKNNKILVKQYIDTAIGTFFMAIAVVEYFNPLGIVVGGVTGIAIIFQNLFNVPVWIINALVNVPLFILGYRILDKDVFLRTLFGTVMLTIFLGAMPEVYILTGDMLVDIIVGSAFMGVGLGLIFAAYSSSGGTDLLAMLIRQKVKYLSVPKIMAVIDGVIVLCGAGVFGLTSGIYALIAIYIVTKLSDAMVEGPNHAKLLYIISNQHDELADYIVKNINRGASDIEITGVFTKSKKNMIMCVASSKELVKIKQKIYQIDENAICFVGDIREAFGEGFTKFRG